MPRQPKVIKSIEFETAQPENQVIVSLKEGSSGRFLDFRNWWQPEPGKWVPTRKGVVLSAEDLPKLREFLGALDRNGACVDTLWLATMLKVISLLGHRPSLLRCLRCGGTTSQLVFSAESGGVLCERCRNDRGGISLHLGAARALDRLLEQPLERAGVVRLKEADVQAATALVNEYAKRLARAP